jgi:hypothetical protein
MENISNPRTIPPPFANKSIIEGVLPGIKP